MRAIALTSIVAMLAGAVPSTALAHGPDPAAPAEPAPAEASPAEPPAGETPPAEADPAQNDRERAAKAYREGSDLYELGKFPEAVEKFQVAWELSHEVQLLYNIGQAYWKWFDVEPDIDHLRQARLFFTNYDKRMRLTEGYSTTEVDNILKAIDAQIDAEEAKIAEANRPRIIGSTGPTEEEIRREQRRRTTRALNISGNTLIVVGSLTLGVGIGGLLARTAYKVILDSSTSTDGGVNLATAEEDEKRRSGFLTSGQVAFGGLIAAAVILPIGIALRVTGAVRGKRDLELARARDGKTDEDAPGKRKAKDKADKQAYVVPTAGGIVVRF